MSERRYYEDAYTTHFEAHIVERRELDNRPAVVLDSTYFYPTGGGQPHDVGTLGGVAVVNVLTDPADHRVLHVLEGAVAGDNVACVVDWTRRFDHMQHHTGQHMLTQAFVQVAQANTVSFHLSVNSVTIDLDRIDLSDAALAEAEALANAIVQENRPVHVRLIDPEAAEDVRIRRIPGELFTDGLRVIEVEDFDRTACGGTHVARTGEIGLIKIIKTERRGQKLRVEFCCGNRALADYARKNTVVNKLMASLNSGMEDIEPALERLRTDLKESRQAHKHLQTQLIAIEAERLLATAQEIGNLRIVKYQNTDSDVANLRFLAGRLTKEQGVIVLAGTSGQQAQIILTCADDVGYDMASVLREVLPLLGAARGGGKGPFAQGGGVPATAEQVRAALDAAEQRIRQALT